MSEHVLRIAWMRVALAIALVGCVHPPAAYPSRSAAAPEATAAPPATMGRALVEDPPLPGQSTEGWTGLAGAPPADPHAGHSMHHHGHHGTTEAPHAE